MKKATPKKKVTLDMVGLDGNAFSILGAFRAQAKKEKWSPKEINEVCDKAMSGDYSNLIWTIANYCK